MKHIEFSTLLEKFEGNLPEAESKAVESHIADCGDCRTAFNKLADLYAYTPDEAFEPVPQAATARILNIYQRKPAAPEPEKKSWFSLDAIVFDDWKTALNERYSGIDSRQLLFSLGEYDLDLRIDLGGGKCTLSGQIFPEIDSAMLEAVSADTQSATQTNELGEFTFDPLPQGVYDIRISNAAGVELNIEKVPLKH